VDEDLAQFLRARLNDDVDQARWMGNMIITRGAPSLGMAPEVAERNAQRGVRVAEARQTLFEETILPYLGTAGPTGRIAEQQLRIFASMYTDHPDYLQEWRP
jgi:hypothetical protein